MLSKITELTYWNIDEAPSAESTEIIRFKNTEFWKRSYKELKSVHSKRENLPNMQERKEHWQKNAKL